MRKFLYGLALPGLLFSAADGLHSAPLDETAMRDLTRYGDGFLVWERLMDGEWQIWKRPLGAGPEERLVPAEPGRDHFCPKISPDGKRLAWLSYPRGKNAYGNDRAMLWVMELASRKAALLADNAQAYHEDRAVLWFDDRRLCFVGEKGRAMELDVVTGKSRILGRKSSDYGWLVNATRTHATTGKPEFAPFDEAKGEIERQPSYNGCQPYFSSDGKWGFWMAGTGGPVSRIFLGTRQTGTILDYDDFRLPREPNYVYFPMVSQDMRLLAFGASRKEHDHFTADYDIFVMRLNPRTLDAIGAPVRYTNFTGVDRYPDVWQAALPLESRFVKGPTELNTKSPDGNKGQWTVDGRDEGSGAELVHRFIEAGDHWVECRVGGVTSRGLVHVSPAAAPQISMVRREEAGKLTLFFNEPVSLAHASVTTEDGMKLSARGLSGEDRIAAFEFRPGQEKQSVVLVAGVEDRAQVPSVMPVMRLNAPVGAWPESRDGLLYAWENKDTKTAGAVADVELIRQGKAFFSPHGGMDMRGGSFELAGLGESLMRACDRSGALSVEAVIKPFSTSDDKEMRPMLSLVDGKGSVGFAICQKAGSLVLLLVTDENPDARSIEQPLIAVPAGESFHLHLGCGRGNMGLFINGARMSLPRVINGRLALGAGAAVLRAGTCPGFPAGSNWPGTLERLAVYDRILSDEEVVRHHEGVARELAARAPGKIFEVRVRLIESSRVPTLEEITPYREALMQNLYEVLPSEGVPQKGAPSAGSRIAVAHWVWVNGERARQAPAQPGSVVTLSIEPTSRHPEIRSLSVRNDLTQGIGADEYLDVSGW